MTFVGLAAVRAADLPSEPEEAEEASRVVEVVVLVDEDRFELQFAAAWRTEARLLISDDVLAAALFACNFEGVVVEVLAAVRTADRRLCVPGDALPPTPLLVGPFEVVVALVDPLGPAGAAGVTEDNCS